MSAEPPKLMILDAVQAKPNSGGGGPNPFKKVKDKIPERDGDMEVTDLDPESVGTSTFPRSIEVQSPTADGAKLLARWSGDPTLSVGDFVDCRQNKKTGVLEIEGYGGGTAAPDISGAWPSPDKIKIGSTEYDTIAAANAAYSSGDTIIFGAGSYALSGATTFTNAKLFAIPGSVTITAASFTYLTLNDCEVFGLDFGSNVPIQITSGTTILDRCVGGNGAVPSGGTLAKFLNCKFAGNVSISIDTVIEGGSYPSLICNGGNTQLNGPEITGISITGSASREGTYFFNGNIYGVTDGLQYGRDSQVNFVRGIAHILEGGLPNNPYPTTRNSDFDSEFNNAEVDADNTIGGSIPPNRWGVGAGVTPTAQDINTSIPNCFYVRKNITNSGDSVYIGFLDSAITGEGMFEVTMLPISTYNRKTGNSFSIRLYDGVSLKYGKLLVEDNATNGLTIKLQYDDGGGLATIASATQTLGVPMPGPLTLGLFRYTAGGNAYVRFFFGFNQPGATKFTGNSYLTRQNMGAQANYQPSELWIVFTGAGTSEEWAIDSVRRVR